MQKVATYTPEITRRKGDNQVKIPTCTIITTTLPTQCCHIPIVSTEQQTDHLLSLRIHVMSARVDLALSVLQVVVVMEIEVINKFL